MKVEMKYIDVSDGNAENAVELPLEEDGTILLTTLSGQFPGACGLKYQPESGKGMRGLRLEDGKVFPPEEGWGDSIYVANIKENTKRKIGETGGGASKLKRVERKSVDLIVLGLAYSATDDDLRSHFSQYGELALVEVKKDPSGSSRGFGFIRFEDPDDQRLVINQRHEICGRRCDVRLPMSKSSGGTESSNPCKLFIGRVPENMTAEDLREYFEQFGEVTDSYKPMPSRGFAFVTFRDPDIAESLCGEDTVIKGKSVYVGIAAPKQPIAPLAVPGGFSSSMGYGDGAQYGYAGFKRGGRMGGFVPGGVYYPPGRQGSGGLSSGMNQLNIGGANDDLYHAAHAALFAAMGNEGGQRGGKPGGHGKAANGPTSSYGSQSTYSQAYGSSYGSNPYYQGP